ncbi:undecaprenyl-phosphate galactose phosphotransferase WbaP [Planctomicrobium sp. SH668]|uniref:undecaprenyl-phosphate galactose phosphotransferase WbaP n=1 Tax=Planctomicrobium sp. SH668 TaxID=3448126 RepID=UPI003F5C80A8
MPLLFLDVVGLLLCTLVASTALTFFLPNAPQSIALGPHLCLYSLVFISIFTLLSLYPGIGLNPITEMRTIARGTLAAGVVLFIFAVASGHDVFYRSVFAVVLSMLALMICPPVRCTARSVLSYLSWWGQPAVVIGPKDSCERLIQVLKQKSSIGLRPVGYIQDHLLGPNNADSLGTLHNLSAIARKHHISWAVIAPSENHSETVSELVHHCKEIPNVVVIPGFSEYPSLWNHTQDIGGLLGICYRERLLDPWAQFCKRAFDISAVLLGSLLLSPILVPLFIVTYVCMKWNSPGPIFYSQDRVGKDRKTFRAWKIRTMVVNADQALIDYLNAHPEMKTEWDLNQKLKNDPRIIPGIGNLLRKASLDELPQLWNVLCGDMSLVGPRPFMTEQTVLYGERLALYERVRPGITGLWQISGRNHTTFERRSQFDAYYVRNWSFWLDIFILGRTVKTVLLREGAF